MVEQNATTMSFVFWWTVQTQTEWVPEDEIVTHHFGRSEQNFDSPIVLAMFLFECHVELIQVTQKETFLFVNISSNADVVRCSRH